MTYPIEGEWCELRLVTLGNTQSMGAGRTITQTMGVGNVLFVYRGAAYGAWASVTSNAD